jgi:hypothetical protein
MSRWVLLFGCAFALAVATPMGFEAEAKKGKSRTCASTGMDGKKTKWQCKAGEKCCFDWLMSKGTCAPNCM